MSAVHRIIGREGQACAAGRVEGCDVLWRIVDQSVELCQNKHCINVSKCSRIIVSFRN